MFLKVWINVNIQRGRLLLDSNAQGRIVNLCHEAVVAINFKQLELII